MIRSGRYAAVLLFVTCACGADDEAGLFNGSQKPVGSTSASAASSLASASSGAPVEPASAAAPSQTVTASLPPTVSASAAPPVAATGNQAAPAWVWVTDTKERFEAQFPALPRAATIPPDPLAGVGSSKTILAMTADGRFSISRLPIEKGDARAVFDASLKAAGSVVTDTTWKKDGRAIEVLGPQGEHVHMRVMFTPKSVYAASTTSTNADNRFSFFDALRFDVEPSKQKRHHDAGRFSVEAPCKLGDRIDDSASPPIIGFGGLLDGNQLSATYADLPGPAAPASVLDVGMKQMATNFSAQLVTIDEADFAGLPSRRFELAAADGMRATVRAVLSGNRLYQLGVFAPTGLLPAWAQPFVDSLALDK
ncbi:MAG: hypothetical protein U0271_46685 [Polyangiaceae bacterium]